MGRGGGVGERKGRASMGQLRGQLTSQMQCTRASCCVAGVPLTCHAALCAVAGDFGAHPSDSHDQARSRRRLLHRDVTAAQPGAAKCSLSHCRLPRGAPDLALIDMLCVLLRNWRPHVTALPGSVHHPAGAAPTDPLPPAHGPWMPRFFQYTACCCCLLPTAPIFYCCLCCCSTLPPACTCEDVPCCP